MHCGTFILITTIIIDNIHEPSIIQKGDQVGIEDPGNKQVKASIEIHETENEYSDDNYPFTLAIPVSWLNKVKVEKLDSGVRFFIIGSDGIKQDIVTINIETVEDRLKFFYEGGPDSSTEIAILENHVYLYLLPLDLSLTNKVDLDEYNKLYSEVPSLIQSFTFTNIKSGYKVETPYKYGYSSHNNELHGFEINILMKWQKLFKVDQSNKEMKLLFR